jgi:hypothetical protein
MTDNPNSMPTGPDEVERELAETLREAAYIFEKLNNGRFQGAIIACRAVARFIHRRRGAAELAGPFLAIAEAFRDLERGGKPKLFSKKTVPEKQRERSPERKHIQRLAAAALEVLVKLTPKGSNIWGDHTNKRMTAADRIARHVNKWPGMRAQDVTGTTVINWRNQQHGLTGPERKTFDSIVENMLAQPNPQQTVEELLRHGPPGLWKS